MTQLKSPDRELAGFITKFSPDVAGLARAAIEKMRSRLPGALVLVYDEYNALAVDFSPTERTSDAIFSIAVSPRHVSLFFLKGATLPDPSGILEGKGKAARHVVLEDERTLDLPAVKTLTYEALRRSETDLRAEPTASGRLIIKSVSEKQRPRRPVARAAAAAPPRPATRRPK